MQALGQLLVFIKDLLMIMVVIVSIFSIVQKFLAGLLVLFFQE